MAGEDEQGRVVSDEERARALLEQLKSVHALDVGRDMVIAAVNFSYPKLGLSDETKAVRDLGDVRLSIELIRAILEVLDRESGDKTGDLHDTLAQMQLAYAHAVQLANAERAAREEAAAGPAAQEAGASEAAAPAGSEAAEPDDPGAQDEASAQDEPSTKPAAKKKPVAKKKAAPKKKPAAED
jgi:hypothetical protein